MSLQIFVFCLVCCLLHAPSHVAWAFVIGWSFFIRSLVAVNAEKYIPNTLVLLDSVLSVLEVMMLEAL